MNLSSQDCLDFLGVTTSQWGHSQTAPVILKLIEDHNICSFVEVGAQTAHLSEIVAKKYPHISVYGIDLHFARPHLSEQYDNLFYIQKDSSLAAKDFSDGIDMVYIDADHHYDAVKKDLISWHPKANKILCGHDYNQPSWPGVKQAVDEFISAHGGAIELADYYNWIYFK